MILHAVVAKRQCQVIKCDNKQQDREQEMSHTGRNPYPFQLKVVDPPSFWRVEDPPLKVRRESGGLVWRAVLGKFFYFRQDLRD